MADRQRTPPPDDIEQRLADLGQHLDWPSDRNLLPDIRQRLAGQPAPHSNRRWFAVNSPSRRIAWASVSLVLLVAMVLAFSDGTRSTVADRLGLPGLSISTEPTVTTIPGGDLMIGTPTTLDEARTIFGKALILPPTDLLGPPDGVYLLESDGIRQVSYLYQPTDSLPEAGESGVGLLISQVKGSTNESFIQKQLSQDTTLEMTTVHDQPAFWLSGAPHIFFYESPDGTIREETIRLAANVLLWEHNGLTIRIETALDRDETVRIAELMR